MSDADDLHATTEDVAADARRLAEIEETKGKLDPADPRVVPLSEEAKRIARNLVPKTQAQLELANEAAEG